MAQRLSVAASLAAVLLTLPRVARGVRDAYGHGLRVALDASRRDVAPPLAAALGDAVTRAAIAVLPAALAATGAWALTHALQTRALWVWPSRARGDGAEPGLGALWLLSLGGAGAWTTWSVARSAGIAPRSVAEVAATLEALLVGTAWRMLACAATLATLELLWRQWRLRVVLTPTDDEARRERRDDEGDPAVRAARQALARAQNVPPTHAG